MKVFIVHAHPESQSFNGALTRAAVASLLEAGHEVRVSDLYEMGWQPVSGRDNFTTVKDPSYFKQQLEEAYATEQNGFSPDIQAELEKLDWCDVLIFQFPLWWFGLPAILKGWVDRVFVMGKIYGGGVWYDNGYFKGKRAFCSVTMGGPAAIYSENGFNGDINQILFPINHGIFYFVGFDVLPLYLVHSPVRLSDSERKAKIDEYALYVLSADSKKPIEYKRLADYNANFVADRQTQQK
jgi:NAD(P)H dehydrogenase (quinone)